MPPPIKLHRVLPLLFALCTIGTALLLSLSGCRGGSYESMIPQVDSTDSRTKTVLRLAADSKQADRFLQALNKSGLDRTLSDLGPWTLFVPVDRGVEGAGYRIDTLFLPALQDSLRKLLSYHIVRGRIDASSIGDSAKIATYYDDKPVVLRFGADSVLYVNESPVLSRTLAQNGSLFMIGSVLHLPPPDTFVTESVLFGK